MDSECPLIPPTDDDGSRQNEALDTGERAARELFVRQYWVIISSIDIPDLTTVICLTSDGYGSAPSTPLSTREEGVVVVV